MGPVTYHTKVHKRGTAWKTNPPKNSPPNVAATTPKAKPKNDSESNDVFDFDEDESQRLLGLSILPRNSNGPTRRTSSTAKQSPPSPDDSTASPSLQNEPVDPRIHQETLHKLKNMEARLAQLEQQQSPTDEQKKRQLERLAQDLEATRRERNDLQDRVDRAESALVTLQRTMEKLQRGVAQQGNTLTALAQDSQKEAASSERLQEKVEASTTTMEMLQKRIQQLENQVTGSEQRIAELEATLQQTKQEADDTREQCKATIQKLETDMAEKERRICRLERVIADATALSRQVKTMLQQRRQAPNGGAVEAPRKRKAPAPSQPVETPQSSKAPRKTNSKQGVSAWLNRFQQPLSAKKSRL